MIVTLDFETYYDQQFSLKKLTTEEYVRSPMFEVIGVSIKLGRGDTYWVTGDKQQLGEALRTINWGECFLLAHNVRFDGFILTEYFGITPKGYLDTLSMARPLHGLEVGGSLAKLAQHYELGEKGTEVLDALGKRRVDFTPEEMRAYAKYCIKDTDLCRALYDELRPQVSKIEMQIIDTTIRMFCEPKLELDTEYLRGRLLKLQIQKQELLDKIGTDRSNLLSNDKFAALLQEAGVTPPKKVSAATGKDTWAFAKTDEEFKTLLEHPNTEVQALLSARFGIKSTLEETRTQRFIDISLRGRLPIPLQYYAAHTGRFGGSDGINMQNLPSRGEHGGGLKKAVRAPNGYVLIDCDSSQIEARVLAWLAGQKDLLDAFKNKEDVYKKMASAIYKKPVCDISKHERQIGKFVVLGCGYGMGAVAFGRQLKAQANVDLPEAELQRIIRAYRESVPYISNLWKLASNCLPILCNKKGEVKNFGATSAVVFNPELGFLLPHGFYQKYPGLHTKKTSTTDANGFLKEETDYFYYAKKKQTRLYGPKIIENLCQAVARCIIAGQMVEIAKRYPVVLTVHDSIIILAKEACQGDAVEFIEGVMSTAPDWAAGLPLACESSAGLTYGG